MRRSEWNKLWRNLIVRGFLLCQGKTTRIMFCDKGIFCPFGRRLPSSSISIHPTSDPSLAPLAPNSAVIKPVGRLAHSPAQWIGLSLSPALSPPACLSVSRLTLHFPRPTATDGPVTPAAAIAPQRPFDDRGRGWVSPPSPAPRLFRGRVRRWRSFYRFSGAIIKRRNFDTGGF